MAALQISTKRPAPKLWRKFENAYIIILAPSIGTAIQTWGLSDKLANRLMIIMGLSAALVKGVGFLIANGDDYVSNILPNESTSKP